MNTGWRQALMVAVAVLAISTAALRADSARRLVQRGNDAYAAGRLDEAMQAYEQADVETPETPVVSFNRGAVHYRSADYAAAREAFAEAARRSRDPLFEATCRYNTGNCWFKEARRQMDSDLKKAVEACASSVDSFQAALALRPDFEEAKHNIEVVRRLWKTILDEQKRRQEEQKAQQEQQQKLEEQLKALIARQEQAAAQSTALATTQRGDGTTQAVQAQATAQAEAQGQLGQDTQAVADSMQQMLGAAAAPPPAPGPAAAAPTPPPGPAHPALGHMAQARGLQDQAVLDLGQFKPQPATGKQTQAAAALRQALESLSQDQQGQDQQGQEQPQPGEQGQEQPKPGDKGQEGEQTKEPDKEKGQQQAEPGKEGEEKQEQEKEPEKGKEQEQQAAAREGAEDAATKDQERVRARLADQDARDILDDEKRNRERRTAAEQRGVQPVDKDW